MIFRFRRSFSCAHFYFQPLWSFEKNQKEFGKCFTEFGHGHDYTLEIEIKGDNLIGLSTSLQKVIDRVDHLHLNFMIPEFKALIPTTENISLYLKSKIAEELQASALQFEIQSLRLNENPEVWVEL